MKRSDFKRTEFLNHTYILLIILVMTLSALTITTRSFASAEQDAKGQPAPAQDSSHTEVRELKLGEPIERELKGGEGHSYRVMLTAGHYLKVVVEQKGIDVVVTLFGPNQNKLIEVDSPNGTDGPEPVVFIAEADGEYRLETRSLEEKAPLAKYEIKIEQLRQSIPSDKDYVAARRIFVDAVQLRLKGTAESLRGSIEKYKEALSLFRQVGDRLEEASTLSEIGGRYWDLADNEKALDYYHQALPLWRALGNSMREGQDLHNIGTAHWQSGNASKALEYFSQALPLLRAAAARQEEAITLQMTGVAYSDLGYLREAFDYFNQALALQRSLGNRRDEAVTLVNIGVNHFKSGDFQKALAYSLESLPLRRVTGDRRGEAATLNNIGALYWRLGQQQQALEYYNQALQLRRETGDRSGEVSTLTNIGVAYRQMDQVPKALKYLTEALSLSRTIGNRRGEAGTLQELGVVHRLLGEPEKAHEYYNQSLLLRQAVGDKWSEAITLSRIGENYVVWGKPREGLDHSKRALAIHEAVGDRAFKAITLQTMARAQRDLGQLNDARINLEAALNIVESTRSTFANQELRTSYLESNQSLYEIYIDLLMQMNKDQSSTADHALAFQVSERARARSLLDILTESRADIRQGVEPALLERERSTQQQLSVRSERFARLLSSKHREEQEKAARKEIEALLTEYQEIQAEIRAKSPRYAALTQPQPLSLKEIQQLLDKDTLLLEYALGEERSYLWAVTPTSVESFELPKRAEIETASRLVYDLFTARNRMVRFEEADERHARIGEADLKYPDAAGALSSMLLGPIANQLKNRRLLIVGDGVLQYLPFAALPLPDSSGRRLQNNYLPLIARNEVVNLPSASTLAILRKELSGRKRASRTVAVLADPVFDGSDERVKATKPRTSSQASGLEPTKVNGAVTENELTRSVRDLPSEEGSLFPLPRLPFTRREAEAIVAFAPAKQYEKAVDFTASRATALDPGMSRYRYIHFATHVILNTRHPELSGIVLSLVDQDGKPQDGFLLSHEVFNLNLPAELVVLSGCKTGLGKEVKGEGLLSLTRGFMYAGSARVLVSLWDVNDKSTAELMAHFYEGMLGKQRLKPAAALRQAQIAMWKSPQWRAPYYWAAFALHGEYR